MAHDDTRSPESLLSDAMDLARRAYWQHVRETCEDIIEYARAMETPDADDLDTYIHEGVDGDAWVIYTAKAQMVLLVSENDGASMEEGLVDASCFKDGIPWSQLAYGALRADIMRQLDAMDFDPSDTDTWAEQDDDAE